MIGHKYSWDRPHELKQLLLTLKHVNSETGCWEYISKEEYPRRRVEGKKEGLHRISSVVFCGYPRQNDKSTFTCHKCDNPKCFNPEHLFRGTPRENTRDSIAKGRHSSVLVAAKTICINGHDIASSKSYYVIRQRRVCKLCAIARERRKRFKVLLDGPAWESYSNMKRLRLIAGLKLRDVARLSGLRISAISSIEVGSLCAGARRQKKLTTAFCKNASDLFDLNGAVINTGLFFGRE